MTVAEIVFERVKGLPEPLAREVLDFVAFLSERAERESWQGLVEAQAGSLSSVWDNPEDAVWDDV